MIHYYICGIRQAELDSNEPGGLYLDFMIEHTSKDIKQIEIAKAMIEHKMVKTTNKEALEATGMSGLAGIFEVIPYMARANNLLVVKFNSKFKLTKEDLENYIKTTPLEELRKARMSF